MVVEELISMLSVRLDPGSGAALEGFAVGAEAAIGGVVAALAAIPIAVTAISVGFAAAGTRMAADMEMITAEITTMLAGNVEQAQALIGSIRDFANVTPYETAPLVENAKTMMSVGIAAEDTVRYMKMIGDVAGGNQEKMGRFVYNFAQVKSVGKLQGEDLRQFATGGFNPLKALINDRSGRAFTKNELKEKVDKGIMSLETFNLVAGKTTAQLQEMSSKGTIGFQQMEDAFKMATSEGGLFYGNLERMSTTFKGRLSTAVDAFKTQLMEVGQRLLPLVGRWLDTISNVLAKVGPVWVEVVDAVKDLFTNLSGDSIESWGDTIADVLIFLVTKTADLIYALTALFEFTKSEFQSLVFILRPVLFTLYELIWHALVTPLSAMLKLVSQGIKLGGKHSPLAGLDQPLDKITSWVDKQGKGGLDLYDWAINKVGAHAQNIVDGTKRGVSAASLIFRDYTPIVGKPPKMEQNNTINNTIHIDPKADPSGRTSLHMKGLKEAVRSAFTIEVMGILGSARGA